MIKKRILVTAVAGDIGSAAVRSLYEAGYEIIGSDMRTITPVRDLLAAFYQSPPATDRQAYFDFVKTVINREHIHCFLPISETEIGLLQAVRPLSEQLGPKLMLNNDVILEHFLDKLKTANYLSSLNIVTPRTMMLNNYTSGLDFPLIVKPRRGWGSKKIWKIENSIDLEYVRTKDDGNSLVQEYIGSDDLDYTTGIFSDGVKVSCISFRRKLGYGGLSSEAVLEDHRNLELLAETIARATSLRGCINLQTRRVKDEFIPYEINPRLSSTLLFRKKFGFDDAVWWARSLEGKSYSYTKRYTSGIAIRYFSEYYYNLK